jgi:hypothetical protein
MGVRPPANTDGTPLPPTFKLRELVGKEIVVLSVEYVTRRDGSPVLDSKGQRSRVARIASINGEKCIEGTGVWLPAWMQFDEKGPAGTYTVVTFKAGVGAGGVTQTGYTLKDAKK